MSNNRRPPCCLMNENMKIIHIFFLTNIRNKTSEILNITPGLFSKLSFMIINYQEIRTDVLHLLKIVFVPNLQFANLHLVFIIKPNHWRSSILLYMQYIQNNVFLYELYKLHMIIQQRTSASFLRFSCDLYKTIARRVRVRHLIMVFSSSWPAARPAGVASLLTG